MNDPMVAQYFLQENDYLNPLAEQVRKILRRLEPNSRVRAFKMELPTMSDTEILARCATVGIRLRAAS